MRAAYTVHIYIYIIYHVQTLVCILWSTPPRIPPTPGCVGGVGGNRTKNINSTGTSLVQRRMLLALEVVVVVATVVVVVVVVVEVVVVVVVVVITTR